MTQNLFVIPATVLEKFRSRGFPEGVTVTAQECPPIAQWQQSHWGSDNEKRELLRLRPQNQLSEWGGWWGRSRTRAATSRNWKQLILHSSVDNGCKTTFCQRMSLNDQCCPTTRCSIHIAKKALEKLLENPSQSKFGFYDMPKLPFLDFLQYRVLESRKG